MAKMTKKDAADAIREVWQQRDDIHCISDDERAASAERRDEVLAALGVKS